MGLGPDTHQEFEAVAHVRTKQLEDIHRMSLRIMDPGTREQPAHTVRPFVREGLERPDGKIA
jgi:hypothetical protein